MKRPYLQMTTICFQHFKNILVWKLNLHKYKQVVTNKIDST